MARSARANAAARDAAADILVSRARRSGASWDEIEAGARASRGLVPVALARFRREQWESSGSGASKKPSKRRRKSTARKGRRKSAAPATAKPTVSKGKRKQSGRGTKKKKGGGKSTPQSTADADRLRRNVEHEREVIRQAEVLSEEAETALDAGDTERADYLYDLSSQVLTERVLVEDLSFERQVKIDYERAMLTELSRKLSAQRAAKYAQKHLGIKIVEYTRRGYPVPDDDEMLDYAEYLDVDISDLYDIYYGYPVGSHGR